jgi:hypothetical protein
MGPYYAYQAFEASRGKSSAELWEADAQLGRLAQSAAGWISRFRLPRRAARRSVVWRS